jgi:hypothetical protein
MAHEGAEAVSIEGNIERTDRKKSWNMSAQNLHTPPPNCLILRNSLPNPSWGQWKIALPLLFR